ncbi:MAG: ATP-binding protein [Deltaproteobacteria bacterium]|nr:ATP-binding protein [Deltaproteobacteria bacterium]
MAPLGSNLANAYFTLRNDHREWEETLAYVRLGLGETVEDVSIEAPPGGGYIALQVKYRGTAEPTPCAALSDGTLAYLAFVALYRLPGAGGLVAFDEPETHLHPALLGRVLDMFESMAHDRPVVLATHSDRLLDGLSDPVKSTLLFELDERRRTRVLRPDASRLEKWLADYRGLGDVRAEGHESEVMRPAGTEPSE